MVVRRLQQELLYAAVTRSFQLDDNLLLYFSSHYILKLRCLLEKSKLSKTVKKNFSWLVVRLQQELLYAAMTRSFQQMTIFFYPFHRTRILKLLCLLEKSKLSTSVRLVVRLQFSHSLRSKSGYIDGSFSLVLFLEQLFLDFFYNNSKFRT